MGKEICLQTLKEYILPGNIQQLQSKQAQLLLDMDNIARKSVELNFKGREPTQLQIRQYLSRFFCDLFLLLKEMKIKPKAFYDRHKYEKRKKFRIMEEKKATKQKQISQEGWQKLKHIRKTTREILKKHQICEEIVLDDTDKDIYCYYKRLEANGILVFVMSKDSDYSLNGLRTILFIRTEPSDKNQQSQLGSWYQKQIGYFEYICIPHSKPEHLSDEATFLRSIVIDEKRRALFNAFNHEAFRKIYRQMPKSEWFSIFADQDNDVDRIFKLIEKFLSSKPRTLFKLQEDKRFLSEAIKSVKEDIYSYYLIPLYYDKHKEKLVFLNQSYAKKLASSMEKTLDQLLTQESEKIDIKEIVDEYQSSYNSISGESHWCSNTQLRSLKRQLTENQLLKYTKKQQQKYNVLPFQFEQSLYLEKGSILNI